MAIDPRYIASLSLQEFFVNKDVDSPVDSGLPLSAGIVTFFRDASREDMKPVYTISGDYPNYTFTALPNPLTLSPVGTPQDNDGNDIVIYYFPFISESDNTPDLYYVTVESAGRVPQFTRESWPPNAGGGGSGGGSDITWSDNFIPNPQFLDHNDLPDDGLLVGGKNPVARGGWYYELPDSPASTNFIRFFPTPGWTSNPAESPPFQLNWICTIPNGADNVKRFGVAFADVNKFADNNQPYGFTFWAKANTTQTVITVQLIKNFGDGGSTEITRNLESFTITNDGKFYNVLIDEFGDNAGEIIGPGSYVALAFSVDPNLAFNLLFTDSGLVFGDRIITNFPIQTNADTISRSIFGWTSLPDPNGFDLYLPPILTLGGMTWDRTQIGQIVSTIFGVNNPSSSLEQNNLMPCDGSAYITEDYAMNGIPFARLGQALISNSPLANIPMFGTGVNYATAYQNAGNLESIRLTVNAPGVISGATNPGAYPAFTISNVFTGISNFGYVAFSNVADTVLAQNTVSDLGAYSAGTSGFTFTTVGGPGNTAGETQGLLAQQNFAFTILCLAGSTLVTGGTAKYFDVDNDSTVNRYWFNTGTEVAPAAGGNVLQQVNVQATDTAQDIANIVREVLCSFQSSLIVINSVPTEGEYWNFSANPSVPAIFSVYYTVGGVGSPPGGTTAIPVPLASSGETNATVALKTLQAIDAYQYASPDLRGMFLRGADPTMIWDFDAAQRWSSVSGLSGAVLGTFEYSQFLSHLHIGNTILPGNGWAVPGGAIQQQNPTNTGGTETRPVNAYVNFAIRY
jgi:hypothetical protein